MAKVDLENSVFFSFTSKDDQKINLFQRRLCIGLLSQFEKVSMHVMSLKGDPGKMSPKKFHQNSVCIGYLSHLSPYTFSIHTWTSHGSDLHSDNFGTKLSIPTKKATQSKT